MIYQCAFTIDKNLIRLYILVDLCTELHFRHLENHMIYQCAFTIESNLIHLFILVDVCTE